MRLIIQKTRFGYAVFEGGKRLSPEVSTRMLAEGHLERLQRERSPATKPRKRPCIRCRQEMISTGPGYRMCDHCRRFGAGLPNQMAG